MGSSCASSSRRRWRRMRCPARGRRSSVALSADRGSFLRVYSMKKEAFQAMGKWLGIVFVAFFAFAFDGFANNQIKCKKGWSQVGDIGKNRVGIVNPVAPDVRDN